jgi:hypothetical protein
VAGVAVSRGGGIPTCGFTALQRVAATPATPATPAKPQVIALQGWRKPRHPCHPWQGGYGGGLGNTPGKTRNGNQGDSPPGRGKRVARHAMAGYGSTRKHAGKDAE